MASDRMITNQWLRNYEDYHPIHREYCQALDETMDAIDKALRAASIPGGNIEPKRELNHIKYVVSTYKDRAQEDIKV